ncbi:MULTISPECIES: c-type cytochrome [Asaia]|uniref:c-type cytochrome n=1 Tax=Asaia TaxID=91914 RepID=UPI0025555523|nr:cytochrome c [Asaia sp. HumB]MDL2169893.1 cytochrome c [Asaia sp. HumB]
MRAPLALALVAALALTACGKKSAGQKIYGPNCGICHHGGNGLPGEVPPLVGRLDLIAKTPEGRDYLARVMLNGLDGPIEANGGHYNFSMPSFRRLSDEQLSLILNWLISRGATHPAPQITPDVIAAARKEEIGSNRVHAMRQALSAKGQIP